MALPKVNELHKPILDIATAADGPLTDKDFIERLRTELSLTDDEVQQLIPSGVRTVVESRFLSARYHLKKAGLIDNPERSQWKITSNGIGFLTQHKDSPIITRAELKIMWLDDEGESTDDTPSAVELEEITPDEQMAVSHAQHQNALSDEVLDSVKAINPSGFERLVVQLLSRMGYGDGRVVGQSRDQGIDGILNQDALGLEKVYVQAKRWGSNPVRAGDIYAFLGSLGNRGATKGVFITTSTFTSEAQKAGDQNPSISVSLIDGRELASLMIRHGVGVVTETTYEVKKLDANYFDTF